MTLRLHVTHPHTCTEQAKITLLPSKRHDIAQTTAIPHMTQFFFVPLSSALTSMSMLAGSPMWIASSLRGLGQGSSEGVQPPVGQDAVQGGAGPTVEAPGGGRSAAEAHDEDGHIVAGMPLHGVLYEALRRALGAVAHAQLRPRQLHRTLAGHDVPQPVAGQDDELVLRAQLVHVHLGLCGRRDSVPSASAVGIGL